jgi:hypothetical protein
MKMSGWLNMNIYPKGDIHFSTGLSSPSTPLRDTSNLKYDFPTPDTLKAVTSDTEKANTFKNGEKQLQPKAIGKDAVTQAEPPVTGTNNKGSDQQQLQGGDAMNEQLKTTV